MSNRCVVSLIAALLPLAGSVAGADASRLQIEPRQVAAILATHSIHVSPNRILVPVVPTHSTKPDLEIAAFEILDPTRARVKLRCRDARDCLPFFATMSWDSNAELENAGEKWKRIRPESASRASGPEAPLLVRTGDTAILVLEGEHVRIQLPVICLSSGTAGKMVRVTTTDRKQIYRAEVVGAGLLRRGF